MNYRGEVFEDLCESSDTVSDYSSVDSFNELNKRYSLDDYDMEREIAEQIIEEQHVEEILFDAAFHKWQDEQDREFWLAVDKGEIDIPSCPSDVLWIDQETLDLPF